MLIVKIDEIPEEGLNLKWEEEKASLKSYLKGLSEIDFDFESPLQSEARIDKTGRSVLIRGKVQTQLRLQCVRCLKEFFYPLSSNFELTLFPANEKSFEEEKELAEEDMESSFFSEGEIHLSEIACEQVFLELPVQPLCQNDCKGLCPVCGGNLNLSSCQCTKEELGGAFAALKNLKLN